MPTDVGRFPDGLALDVEGNLYVCCYASDEIWRISPDRKKTLLAHDRWGILLGRPTNLAFGGKTSTKSMSPTSAAIRLPAPNWESAASRRRTCK